MSLKSLNSRLVFILIVGALAGGVLYASSFFFLAQQWEAGVVIRVGQVPSHSRGEPKLLASLDEVEQFLRGRKAALPEALALRIRRVSESMVDVRVSSATQVAAENARLILLSDLFTEHNRIYFERVGFWGSEMAQARSKIDFEKRINEEIISFCWPLAVANVDLTFKCAVLMIDQSNRANRIYELESELTSLMYDLQESFSYKTSIYGGEIVEVDKSISLFRVLIGMISAFSVSAMLMVYFRFFERQ